MTTKFSILACASIAFQLAALGGAKAEPPALVAVDLAQPVSAPSVEANMQRAQLLLPPQGELSLAADQAAPVKAPGASAYAATPTQEKSDCSWATEGSNSWHCKIQPLARHDLQLRRKLDHLWPLHGKTRDQ